MHIRERIALAVAAATLGGGLAMASAAYGADSGRTVQASTASGSHSVAAAPDRSQNKNVGDVIALTAAKDSSSGGLSTLASTDGHESALRFPGTYQWMPEHFSGPCITAHGGVYKGAKLDQYRCIGAANQKWHIEAGPYYGAKIIHSPQNLGLCVDIPGGNYSKGTQLILWSCNGHENQTFVVSCAAGQRHCSIRPYIGNQRSKCLSVKGGGTANNTPLILWRCNEARDQEFTFR